MCEKTWKELAMTKSWPEFKEWIKELAMTKSWPEFKEWALDQGALQTVNLPWWKEQYEKLRESEI